MCESVPEERPEEEEKVPEIAQPVTHLKPEKEEEIDFDRRATAGFPDFKESKGKAADDFSQMNFDAMFADLQANDNPKPDETTEAGGGGLFDAAKLLDNQDDQVKDLPPKKDINADDHQISFFEDILEQPSYGLDFLRAQSSKQSTDPAVDRIMHRSMRLRREANPKGKRPVLDQSRSPDRCSEIISRLTEIEKQWSELVDQLPFRLRRKYTSSRLGSNIGMFSPQQNNSVTNASSGQRAMTQGNLSDFSTTSAPKAPKRRDRQDNVSVDLESIFSTSTTPLKNATSSPNLHQKPNTKIDLAFLFSSPLVMNLQTRSGEVKMSPMPAIDYQTEFNEILDSLHETGNAVRFRKMVSTVENFRMILTEKPNALHFSGHGIQNNQRFFPNHELKGQGNFLVFEHGKGDANFVSEERLTKLIQASKIKLEFVFVASCYSQFAGQVFLKAGAKHVVCVRKGEQISDTAVSKFSKAFYHGIFSQNLTVCQAFNTAKHTVLGEEEGERGANEGHKFRLLINEDNDDDEAPCDMFGNKLPHQCNHLPVPEKGTLQQISKSAIVSKIKAKVDDFLGRSVEMQSLITYLHQNRLVTIKGIPGIGKTSLAKQVGYFLQERLTFKNGIIYQSVRGLNGIESAISQIHFSLFNHPAPRAQMMKMITAYLEDKQVLFIFDNAQDLLQVDQEGLRRVIGQIIQNCPNTRCLLTSRCSLGAVAQVTEKIMNLPQLSRTDTANLLFRKSPRPILERQVQELLEAHHEQAMNFGKKGGKGLLSVINRQPARRLAEHPIIYLLGGHPQAISLAAPLLEDKTLLELYEVLNSTQFLDELHSCIGGADNSLYSLQVSLDLSLSYLKDKDPHSIQLFYDLGLMPGGVSKQELAEIWKKRPWKTQISSLQRASLLVRRIFTLNQNARWVLLPFMTRYAQSKLNEQDTKDMHARILEYYSNLCKKCFRQIGKKEQLTGEKQMNKASLVLMESETNIWACLN